MAKYTEKQNQWTQDYIKKAYDDIKVRVPKGDRDKYKAYAESKGISLNQLIINLLDYDMATNGVVSGLTKENIKELRETFENILKNM